MPPVIEVVCGVIEDGAGRLLACRRPAGKHLGGQWELPGGKLEPGESPAAALHRELREELAIETAIGDPLRPVEHDYGGLAIRLHPLRCRITAGTPHPHEHAEIRWVAANELAQLEWAAADLPVLDQWRGV
jgi:8-oxo-dGTP diphosphatase